ncbi:MAG: RNA pyrophosphohydrolase [Sulfuricurvum sp. PC08-66]|nr:MAG: RNA pyrophosphohydrolase [Sulfuricurvum sp. PC08-66]
MSDLSLYRPNVAAIIVSPRYPQTCEIFIAERSDIAGAWQFPQGGIDEGESVREALYRELKEEIGTDAVEIIAEFPDWVTYDFPTGSIMERMKPFKGQKQRYFLVRLAQDAKINLSTEIPEFSQFEYVGLDTLFTRVAHFKRPVYKEVIKHFQKEGYL